LILQRKANKLVTINFVCIKLHFQLTFTGRNPFDTCTFYAIKCFSKTSLRITVYISISLFGQDTDRHNEPFYRCMTYNHVRQLQRFDHHKDQFSSTRPSYDIDCCDTEHSFRKITSLMPTKSSVSIFFLR
jgi:hypothetical protein